MPTKRANNSCALMTSTNGEKVVVVIGGNDGTHYDNSVAYYNVETGIWTLGEISGMGQLYDSFLIGYKDTVLLIGVTIDSNGIKKGQMYQYHKNGTWILFDARITVPPPYGAVMLFDDSNINITLINRTVSSYPIRKLSYNCSIPDTSPKVHFPVLTL